MPKQLSLRDQNRVVRDYDKVPVRSDDVVTKGVHPRTVDDLLDEMWDDEDPDSLRQELVLELEEAVRFFADGSQRFQAVLLVEAYVRNHSRPQCDDERNTVCSAIRTWVGLLRPEKLSQTLKYVKGDVDDVVICELLKMLRRKLTAVPVPSDVSDTIAESVKTRFDAILSNPTDLGKTSALPNAILVLGLLDKLPTDWKERCDQASLGWASKAAIGEAAVLLEDGTTNDSALLQRLTKAFSL
jgi:hypothetical protein